VLLQTCDATLADRDNGLVVARHAIVSDHALQWPEAITAAEKASAIAQLKAHRLRREAKIAAAMQALPNGTLAQWVERAYDDVPPRLWPVAARSLQAHVDHIRESLGA